MLSSVWSKHSQALEEAAKHFKTSNLSWLASFCLLLGFLLYFHVKLEVSVCA